MPKIQQLGLGEERPRIAVMGCGGAGCNILHFIPPTSQLEVIGLNDVPHPSLLGIKRRLLVSEDELETISTLDDEVVKTLSTDLEKLIARELIGFNIVVVIAGLGGNTGSHGANAVTRVARLHNMTTWGIVTLPFSAEGLHRRQLSKDGLDRLRNRCPAALTFSNDKLLDLVPDIPIAKAFKVMGQIMIRPLEALSQILTKNDVRYMRIFFESCNELRLGIGEGSGRHRSFIAVEEALSSPWIDFDVGKVRQAMIIISGAQIDEQLTKDVLHDFKLHAPLADILWGSYTEGDGEVIRVSVMVPPS